MKSRIRKLACAFSLVLFLSLFMVSQAGAISVTLYGTVTFNPPTSVPDGRPLPGATLTNAYGPPFDAGFFFGIAHSSGSFNTLSTHSIVPLQPGESFTVSHTIDMADVTGLHNAGLGFYFFGTLHTTNTTDFPEGLDVSAYSQDWSTDSTLIGTPVPLFTFAAGQVTNLAAGQAFTGPLMGFPDSFDTVQIGTWEVRAEAVPEPTTMLLLGLGLIGIAGMRRKMQK